MGPALGPTTSRLLARLLAGLPPGGRDAALLERQVLLTKQNADSLYKRRLPGASTYQAGLRPDLERLAFEISADARAGLATASALTHAVARLSLREHQAVDRDEASILASGSASTLERARTLSCLAAVSGLDARVCVLYNEAALQVHAVCEIGIMNGWTVFDPAADRYFLYPHRGYASALDIMLLPSILDNHPDHGRLSTVDSGYYRTIAVCESQPIT